MLLETVRKRKKELYQGFYARLKVRNKTKYFCIGRNKTGTTSLKKAFEDLGFIVANQRKAELLTDQYYFDGNFEPIIEFCKTAQVFQDVPFSYPETFKYLDKAYPGSKFILTIRNSADQWYRSLTRAHARQFGRGGYIPTAEDLQAATYVRKGYMYNVVRVHGTSDKAPYDERTLTEHYERYNRCVREYFAGRPDDLLVINVAEPGAYQRFVEFVGVDSSYAEFPWENRT